MQEILVHIDENKISFVDYLPYIISILSVISTLIITIIQSRHNYKLHKRNSSFDIKKDAIFEALNFLDTYISWLDINNGVIPVRKYIDKTNLTIQARQIHNKLCITCKNKKIAESFVYMICPDLKEGENFPVFEKYDEFRNECRKELGIDTIKFSTDKGYIYRVNTRALEECSQKNEEKG